jgi:hypothetical protein
MWYTNLKIQLNNLEASLMHVSEEEKCVDLDSVEEKIDLKIFDIATKRKYPLTIHDCVQLVFQKLKEQLSQDELGKEVKCYE